MNTNETTKPVPPALFWARWTAASYVLVNRWTAYPYSYDEHTARNMAELHLKRHWTRGTLADRIAVIMGEMPGCENCELPASTVTGHRSNRCERCQHLPSDEV